MDCSYIFYTDQGSGPYVGSNLEDGQRDEEEDAGHELHGADADVGDAPQHVRRGGEAPRTAHRWGLLKKKNNPIS